MITELITFRGFPYWFTRKDKLSETVLTMDHINKISIGDGFSFFLKPPAIPDENGIVEPLMKEIEFLRVSEILESRPSKGKYVMDIIPTHYKLKCKKVAEVIDVNSVIFSTE